MLDNTEMKETINDVCPVSCNLCYLCGKFRSKASVHLELSTVD